MLENENLETLKSHIRDIYINEYIPLSKKIIENTLAVQFIPGSFESLYDVVDQAERLNKTEGIMKEVKDRLLDVFPVVLTTADAVQSNFYTNIKNDNPIDCIVIDEASQCDILSALPLLYLARRIVVVGDSKQLEAIKNLELEEIETEVEDGWDFVRESFLTTITKTLHPVSNMLLEHYRCDYNIINYCNKYFYDNQLLIYRTTTGHSMVLIDNDKGKYVEQEEGSFYNSREQETISQKIGDDVSHTFIITPFRKQGEKLSRRYGKQRCGTIHTFQGRGESEVWFSTVLNDTQEAKRHLAGNHNLFSRELINVAVSRAKDKFSMVADVEFFKQYDENVANLIEYIETYGERIPDKTVCLFDYLYRQMPLYKAVGTIDNPFEEALWKFLKSYLPKLEHFECSMKLPLAAVVTDGNYLAQNPDVKRYIENHAHLDYIIYDTS
ncbi:DEAD/DEAH box helicase [Clostridium sp. AM58-1XD]|uniref:DEAD/DEAH box helicase n=1 Tax=Clostridium sp. AM58-1XD TaxID=2292307 RepID=UPI000E518D90|nr:DEAD/DEAH box helicase [Clostridium sp. AM58-1XD]RGY97928.1 hypothetical protein DXA13_12750 [Clostridium sp. AM58-1XD]